MGNNNEEDAQPAPPEPAVQPRPGRRSDNQRGQSRSRANSIGRTANGLLGKGQKSNRTSNPRRPGLGLEHANDSVTLVPYKKGSIDDGTAYGEYSPKTFARVHRDRQSDLRDLLVKTETTMRDARVIGSSAIATIEKLKQDPKIFAPVALSLSEISKLAATIAPAALFTMKAMYPAAFALLASPQFLVAGSITAGATVVMLGGYKIIRQLANYLSGGGVERPLAIGEPPVRGRRAIADRPRDASHCRGTSQSCPRAAPDEINELQTSVFSIADWIPGFQAIGTLLASLSAEKETHPSGDSPEDEMSAQRNIEAPPQQWAIEAPPQRKKEPPPHRSIEAAPQRRREPLSQRAIEAAPQRRREQPASRARSMRRSNSQARHEDEPVEMKLPPRRRDRSAGPPPQRQRSVGRRGQPNQDVYADPGEAHNEGYRPRPRPHRAYEDAPETAPRSGRSRSKFRSMFGR